MGRRSLLFSLLLEFVGMDCLVKGRVVWVVGGRRWSS
jgi:hypothetical protein